MPPTELRCVIDTNVLISAALFADSIPGQVLRHVLRHGSLLASPRTLTELAEVLGRPKLDRYLTWPEREHFLAALADRVELVEPDLELAVCRDPDDNAILELAVAGRAAAIIAGDPDLLALHPFQGIPILSPRSFTETLMAGG
ncbi:MAG: putative toxin-antitoxin system toxin component, PIN family [Gammaproteobacteria bacterium]|jgi:putative PIN family toxin of toxin-antitoxin system|nr:putative toxin-antitoxin system toxin component, PIN family [Gammaproteobacteria bacterium]